MDRHVWPLIVLLFCTAAAGCQRSSSDPGAEETSVPPWFQEVTGEWKLHFVHAAGPIGDYFMPQIMGSGGALFDYNNDGRLDIYLVQNAGPSSKSTNRLFRQEPDGRFVDVSQGSGLDVAGYGMGVAIGDVNNDGLPDVLVTEYGGIRLFLNNGNGTFTDVTQEAGLDNLLWGTSACFFDYDRDGWLDLVVVNYVDYSPGYACGPANGKPDYCHPSNFAGSVAKLFHNLGRRASGGRQTRGLTSGGRQPPESVPKPGGSHSPLAQGARPPLRVPMVYFEDVTLPSGLGRVPGPGLGVVCADFDGDGWPDIFVANDSAPNRLWINQRDGTFREEAVVRGIAFNALGRAQANMGIALGDVDGACPACQPGGRDRGD